MDDAFPQPVYQLTRIKLAMGHPTLLGWLLTCFVALLPCLWLGIGRALYALSTHDVTVMNSQSGCVRHRLCLTL